MNQIFEFLGRVIAYGGGGAAAAYLLFQYLGKTWIENKFAERLEQLRHSQALELQRLRVEIDSLLTGTLKIQEKEFELLPEAWALFDEASGKLSHLVSPIQEYPDLDRHSQAALEEFLQGSRLSNSQRDEIRQARDKTNLYQQQIFWYHLSDVQAAIAKFHNFVERNCMFFPPEIRSKLVDVSDKLWEAMTSKKFGHAANDWKMADQGWEKVKKEIDPMREDIRQTIYDRLHSHGEQH